MSYILDALNKSETERRATSLPGMAGGASFMVAPQRSSSRRGSAAILVGVGMLVTGLALGSWRPWQNVPVPPPVELAAAAPLEAPATASPAGTAAPKSVAQLKPQPTVPVVTKPKTPPKPPVTVQAEAPASAPEATAAQPKATKASKVAKADKADKADKSAAADADAPAPAKRVVAYRELPAKVQSRLPAISFGGFAGVDESEVKIAFINNRLVKEGEEVSPGLKLEKVGNDGVVLAYQGHRFRP